MPVDPAKISRKLISIPRDSGIEEDIRAFRFQGEFQFESDAILAVLQAGLDALKAQGKLTIRAAPPAKKAAPKR
jgi:hypothetical protein